MLSSATFLTSFLRLSSLAVSQWLPGADPGSFMAQRHAKFLPNNMKQLQPEPTKVNFTVIAIFHILYQSLASRMRSKTSSAASGTVHKTDAGISYAHLIPCRTAYIIYPSDTLSSSLLLLATKALNDLHDLWLASSYSTVRNCLFHILEEPSGHS